jgi:hypothetical protein
LVFQKYKRIVATKYTGRKRFYKKICFFGRKYSTDARHYQYKPGYIPFISIRKIVPNGSISIILLKVSTTLFTKPVRAEVMLFKKLGYIKPVKTEFVLLPDLYVFSS